MTLTLITGPATEPVDRTDAKLHLRVSGSEEDTLIDGLIAAARLSVEAHASVALISQTWKWVLDAWPGDVLDLPLGPVSSIVSVVVDGTTLLASTYILVPGRHARLLSDTGGQWTSPTTKAGGIEITFVAGFGSSETDVPRDLRHAILMLVAHWFENREPTSFAGTTLPTSVTALLAPYRQVRL